MAEFKGVDVFTFPRAGVQVTENTLYWKQLSVPVTIKDSALISYVSFSSEEPYPFAITCSSRVQIYHPLNRQITGRFSKFPMTAYGGIFRRDNKLLGAGCEDGAVRLFDVKTRSLLRNFKGHKGPTQRCTFSTEGTKLFSFSDDKTVRLWDIGAQKCELTFEGHGDYVRCGAVCQANPDVVLSGSYDHKAQLFDLRSGRSVLTVDHGSPVESVLILPSGCVFLTAGGNHVKVWDVSGGRQLAQITQHHKTVTCMCLGSNGQRLLTGSLDRHVKVVDVSTYQVVHSFDYPSPILSLGISPEDKVLVVGMTTGLVSVQSRKFKDDTKAVKEKPTKYRPTLHHNSFESSDEVVSLEEKKKLADYNRYLRTFQFSKALDSVMYDHFFYKRPHATISVLKELIRRKAIKSALSGRSDESLYKILNFVAKYIQNPSYTRTMIDVALILIDLYEDQVGQEKQILSQFQRLKKIVDYEMIRVKEMLELKGSVEMILANSCERNKEEILNDLPLPEVLNE